MITFCDSSNAFNRVGIRGLIFSLERYGMKGKFLCWLESYLFNRSQRVVLRENVPSLGFLQADGPQGRVL